MTERYIVITKILVRTTTHPSIFLNLSLSGLQGTWGLFQAPQGRRLGRTLDGMPIKALACTQSQAMGNLNKNSLAACLWTMGRFQNAWRKPSHYRQPMQTPQAAGPQRRHTPVLPSEPLYTPDNNPNSSHNVNAGALLKNI